MCILMDWMMYQTELINDPYPVISTPKDVSKECPQEHNSQGSPRSVTEEPWDLIDRPLLYDDSSELQRARNTDFQVVPRLYTRKCTSLGLLRGGPYDHSNFRLYTA